MFKVPNLNDFLRACASFHRKEYRASAFSKAVRTVQKGNKVEGIFYLLKIWNRRWSGTFPDHVLKEQIKDAIKDVEGILGELEGKSLRSVNLVPFNKSEKSNKIRESYDVMRDKEAINKTGATKALHLLNQDLFMMWDSYIRERYHSDWFEENHIWKHTCGGSDCYLEFMRNCQSFAEKLVKQENEQKIVERHLQEIGSGWKSSETLAKMIDEYNYMQITY